MRGARERALHTKKRCLLLYIPQVRVSPAFYIAAIAKLQAQRKYSQTLRQLLEMALRAGSLQVCAMHIQKTKTSIERRPHRKPSDAQIY